MRIEDYAETLRGHRVLHLVGKGSKPATMPLTVPVLRVLEACRGERTEGPGHTHALYAYQLRRWFGLVIRPNSGKAIDRRDAYRMVAPERKMRRSGHGMHLAMESKPRHSSPHTW